MSAWGSALIQRHHENTASVNSMSVAKWTVDWSDGGVLVYFELLRRWNPGKLIKIVTVKYVNWLFNGKNQLWMSRRLLKARSETKYSYLKPISRVINSVFFSSLTNQLVATALCSSWACSCSPRFSFKNYPRAKNTIKCTLDRILINRITR